MKTSDKHDIREETAKRLRDTTDKMIAVLGAHGTISARDDRVQDVLRALYDYDEARGVFI